MTGPTVMVDVAAESEPKNLFLCASKFFSKQEKEELKRFRHRESLRRDRERRAGKRPQHPQIGEEVLTPEESRGIPEMEALLKLHRQQMDDAYNVYEAKVSQIANEEHYLEEAKKNMAHFEALKAQGVDPYDGVEDLPFN